MDSYENEASKFAAQRTKLKNICEAHDLTYTFIKNSYPIKLIIRPIKGVGEQMSMLETASEDSYISPDAYLLFTMKDGVLVYRMSKTFTIEDALFGKIKNIFKNMHSYYCQFFFRELIESGRLKAIGGKMPEFLKPPQRSLRKRLPTCPRMPKSWKKSRMIPMMQTMPRPKRPQRTSWQRPPRLPGRTTASRRPCWNSRWV